MKNKNQIFAILILVLLFVCCSSNTSTNTGNNSNSKISNIKYIHLPQFGENTLKASSFADTVLYVPLETTKESILDNIKGIWINNSYILVNCVKGGLFQFQKNGKFIRRIGKIGKGPGEYLCIYYFDVIRDTIYVTSRGRRGFLRYSLKGNWYDEIKLKYEPFHFSVTSDQKLVCYLYNEGKVLVYNKNFNSPDTIIVEHGVTKGRNYYTCGGTFMTYFQKSTTGLLFNSYLSDTIWNINKHKKEPAFIFDLKNKLLPYDKRVEFCKGDFNKWSEVVKPFYQVHTIPFQSLMFIFQTHWYASKFDAIYINNVKSGEIKRYNTSYIDDDIVGKQKLSGVYFINSPDYLVSDIDPMDIQEYLSQNKNNKDKVSQAWVTQMKKIKVEANPILVLMKIKKKI